MGTPTMDPSSIDWAGLRAEGLSGFSLSVMPPTLSLPALPHAVTVFLQRSADESVPLEDLARIVETDAGLTVELLKRVNSASSGISVRVKSISQALALLGRRPTRMFLTTIGTEAAIRARKSKLINQNSFWNVCLQRALFAREVARLLKTDVDAAFAGGLLQDFLLPILSNELFDIYLEFVGQGNTAPEALAQFEQAKFEWDHAMAGACLAFQWNLPDELVCCLLYHHAGLRMLSHPKLGRSPVAAVALAAMIPDPLHTHHGMEQLVKLEKIWPDFNLEILAAAVDLQQEQAAIGVRNDFPLSRRVKSLRGERQQASAEATASAMPESKERRPIAQRAS
ncbi:MAG TPA: HDOD domain-containing protein [Planctomycetaceae bacterium]|jgi:HD-like signal output (HDOD) protein|nr:HDOD domain-containing protein [Planctomycetaceae bacterium]